MGSYGAANDQEKKQKYACAMHPEVVTDHPGNRPKCGMKLVPLKQAKRQTSTPINRELRHRVDTERVVGGNVDWLLTLSPYPQFPLLAIGSLLFCINTNPGAVRIKGNEAEKKMKPW